MLNGVHHYVAVLKVHNALFVHLQAYLKSIYKIPLRI